MVPLQTDESFQELDWEGPTKFHGSSSPKLSKFIEHTHSYPQFLSLKNIVPYNPGMGQEGAHDWLLRLFDTGLY